MLSSVSPGPSVPHRSSPRKAQSPFTSNPRGQPQRLGTPSMRRTSSPRKESSPNKSMDKDNHMLSLENQGEEGRVFALSDTLSVRLAATHPIEMQQAFQAADPRRDIFVGSLPVLNSQSIYSVVTSVQTCFVWKIDLSSPFHPPTCYMFPVPPPDTSAPYLTVPFASLLPFGASREPGLILVSSAGEVRFWDSIGTGLAGAERFSTTRIDLAESESVEGIEHVEATAIYIARTKSRLHRLTVTARPGTGKFVVVSTPFLDPQEYQGSSWLNPLRMLHRRNAGWEGSVVAVVSPSIHGNSDGKSRELILRSGEERPIWVLTSKNLMKFHINLEGGEQCEFNNDVKEVVTQAILNGVEGVRLSLDLELLDVAVDTSGNPTLLISHSPIATQEISSIGLDVAPARVYALVRLRLSPRSEAFLVDGALEVLPYELAPNPQRASPPRLGHLEYPARDGMSDELKLAFSQFPDAFAFTSCVPPYQEQLHLKSADDMILGFNILEHADGQEVLLLTSGMVLAARPNFENITKMKDNVHIGKASVLKSTIRQAMKYGIKLENPLRFQLPSIADGESLKTAAEQMSHAFLNSDSDVVPPHLSMGAQLSGRQNSLRALVTFIGESGGLGKLSQSTREQLLADAEKLAAARGLWDCHNEQTQRVVSHNLLPTVISGYMSRNGISHRDDGVRQFFNFQVQHVGALIPEILGMVKTLQSSSESPKTKTHMLVQANGLVQAIFTQAFKYRSANRPSYHINGSVVQPWTSEPDLLAALRQLFDISVQLRIQGLQKIQVNDEVFGGSNVQDELTSQLRELASCLFKAYKDRLDFLDSRSTEGSGNERERNRFEEEFHAIRPEVFAHLVRIDSTDFAFQLAETYRDFHALSELSYHSSAIKIMPATKRIRDYIQRYRADFTSELYKWYIEQGKLKLMFDQESEFADEIDSFFSENPNPRISWVHDLGKQDYHHAASALLEEAEKETSQETRHLMLSIGKLASMAEGPAATPQDKVEAFNNSLDFMAIHDTLLGQFNEEFGSPVDFAVESRVQAITSTQCAIPSDRGALVELFRRILRQLLHGNALTEEDAVDLLSMKENSKHPSDFVDALVIVSNSHYMSESRKRTLLRNIWRRIYLHDNWKRIRETANNNEYELAANLRGTQLYKALVSPSLPRDSVLSPSEASEVPTKEEITARWPGMAPNQVKELCQDFATESKVLVESGPSDTEFIHVRKLAGGGDRDTRGNV